MTFDFEYTPPSSESQPLSEVEQLRQKLAASEAKNAELESLNTELEKKVEVLAILADKDPLTGLENRRSGERKIRAELARNLRNGTKVAMIMLDIDHFKEINDYPGERGGHENGDRVLQELAQKMLYRFRLEDIVIRWGGEEFLIVLGDLPIDTSEEALVALIHKQLLLPVHEISRTPLTENEIIDNIIENPLAVSVGCTMVEPDGQLELSKAINEADRLLYEAKNGGRNRIVSRNINRLRKRSD